MRLCNSPPKVTSRRESSSLRLRAVCLPYSVANIRTGLCSVGVRIPAQHTEQATRDRRDNPLDSSAVLVVQEWGERVLHGVTDEAPSEPTSRTLTLLGKTLINRANLCEFGRKESFMAEMNHAFIRPSLQVMPAPHDPFLPPLTTLFLHPCLISSAPRCRALATFSTCLARALRATDRGRMRSSSATGARSTSPRWIDG